MKIVPSGEPFAGSISKAMQISFEELEVAARGIVVACDAHPEISGDAVLRQIIALGEEAGEFQGAARRYLGMARRPGTREEMEEELADVVITAFVTAVVLDIDLRKNIADKLSIIFSRGWKNE